MSSITETKRLRILDWSNDKRKVVRSSFLVPAVHNKDGSLKRPLRYTWSTKELKGGLVRREDPIPSTERRSAGNCFYCKRPVYTSMGQIYTIHTDRKTKKSDPSHKPCRKANQ